MGWGPQSKFRPISDAYREGMDRIAKNKAEKEAEEAKEVRNGPWSCQFCGWQQCEPDCFGYLPPKKAKLTNKEDK